MEEMAAGSLFTAARGMDRPGGAALDERGCLERGQFMSGACAGLIHEVRKLRVLSPRAGRRSSPAASARCGVDRENPGNSILRGRPWTDSGSLPTETIVKGLPSPG